VFGDVFLVPRSVSFLFEFFWGESAWREREEEEEEEEKEKAHLSTFKTFQKKNQTTATGGHPHQLICPGRDRDHRLDGDGAAEGAGGADLNLRETEERVFVKNFLYKKMTAAARRIRSIFILSFFLASLPIFSSFSRQMITPESPDAPPPVSPRRQAALENLKAMRKMKQKQQQQLLDESRGRSGKKKGGETEGDRAEDVAASFCPPSSAVAPRRASSSASSLIAAVHAGNRVNEEERAAEERSNNDNEDEDDSTSSAAAAAAAAAAATATLTTAAAASRTQLDWRAQAEALETAKRLFEAVAAKRRKGKNNCKTTTNLTPLAVACAASVPALRSAVARAAVAALAAASRCPSTDKARVAAAAAKELAAVAGGGGPSPLAEDAGKALSLLCRGAADEALLAFSSWTHQNPSSSSAAAAAAAFAPAARLAATLAAFAGEARPSPDSAAAAGEALAELLSVSVGVKGDEVGDGGDSGSALDVASASAAAAGVSPLAVAVVTSENTNSELASKLSATADALLSAGPPAARRAGKRLKEVVDAAVVAAGAGKKKKKKKKKATATATTKR